MKTNHHLLGIALALGLSLAAAPARAEPDAQKLAQAAAFFDAGAEAYKAGQYLVAAEALLKAHEITPSPALLFSAAQAYRRQYLAEPTPKVLRRAVGLYRDYLRIDKNAKRREDAVHALEALVPIEARLAPEGEGDAAKEDAAARGTRLLLSAPAAGAEVSLDGAPFTPTPLVAKVQPGTHRVRVRALGYFEEEITVQAIPGELVPSHVQLRERPARIRVEGTYGARVLVDGREIGMLPFVEPIAVEPGSHFVAVTRGGHKPFSKTVEVGRDAEVKLTADLRSTPARIAAWTIVGAGAAAATVGGVLMGFAIARENEAVALQEKRKAGSITEQERDAFNAATAARNDFARAAAITGGVGAAALLLTGGALFAFDRPEIPPRDERQKMPTLPKPKIEFEVGFLSAGVRGVF